MSAKKTQLPDAAVAIVAPTKKSNTSQAHEKVAVSATSAKLKKGKPPKDVTCTFRLTEPEYAAIQELREKFTETIGNKVKKADLLRVASRILLNLTPAKVKAELAKLQAP